MGKSLTHIKDADGSQPHPETLGGLAKGLAVLECFSLDRQRLTISQAAVATEISPAAARRCLRTLEHLGYVFYDGKYYRLTPRLNRLASVYSDLPLSTLAIPHLEMVRDTIGRSTSLAVLEGSHSLFVARAEVDFIVTAAIRVGSRIPAPMSSTGRVMLAALGDEAIRAHIDTLEWPGFTGSRSEKDGLFKDILQVRRDGYAHMVDIHDVGRTIAVPVVDARGATHAAMSTVTFANQQSLEEMRAQCLATLLGQARNLGNKL